MFDPFDNPPPSSEQQIAERKYRKVVGIVRHNAPAGIDEIRACMPGRMTTIGSSKRGFNWQFATDTSGVSTVGLKRPKTSGKR